MKKLLLYSKILLFFNGISATIPGLILVFDPGGESMKMPLDWLEYSPFENFLIPGILLFLFIGVLSLISAILTIKKSKGFQLFIIANGLIMFGWLTIEIIIIKAFYAPLHVPYYFTGISLLILGLIINSKLSKK